MAPCDHEFVRTFREQKCPESNKIKFAPRLLCTCKAVALRREVLQGVVVCNCFKTEHFSE